MFDSSVVLVLRGGILTLIGNFPESLRQAILVPRDNLSREIGRTTTLDEHAAGGSLRRYTCPNAPPCPFYTPVHQRGLDAPACAKVHPYDMPSCPIA